MRAAEPGVELGGGARFCSEKSAARAYGLLERFKTAKRLRREALAKTACEPEDKGVEKLVEAAGRARGGKRAGGGRGGKSSP